MILSSCRKSSLLTPSSRKGCSLLLPSATEPVGTGSWNMARNISDSFSKYRRGTWKSVSSTWTVLLLTVSGPAIGVNSDLEYNLTEIERWTLVHDRCLGLFFGGRGHCQCGVGVNTSEDWILGIRSRLMVAARRPRPAVWTSSNSTRFSHQSLTASYMDFLECDGYPSYATSASSPISLSSSPNSVSRSTGLFASAARLRRNPRSTTTSRKYCSRAR